MATRQRADWDESARPHQLLPGRLALLWVALVAIYFAWESVGYRGLYRLVAEWQYAQFGRCFPTLSFAMLVLLFALPAALLPRLHRRGRGEDRAASANDGAEAVVIALTLRRLLFGVAVVFAVAALAMLLVGATRPAVRAPTQSLAVGSPASIAPRPGPTLLRGEIDYAQTAIFSQNALGLARALRVAPMLPPGDRVSPIRYFVEVDPQPAPDPTAPPPATTAVDRSGELMTNALPGSILQLYRYAGFDVEPTYYFLYTSTASIRTPFYVSATQLAVAAVLAALVGLIQSWHVRGLRRRVQAAD